MSVTGLLCVCAGVCVCAAEVSFFFFFCNVQCAFFLLSTVDLSKRKWVFMLFCGVKLRREMRILFRFQRV